MRYVQALHVRGGMAARISSYIMARKWLERLGVRGNGGIPSLNKGIL